MNIYLCALAHRQRRAQLVPIREQRTGEVGDGRDGDGGRWEMVGDGGR